MKKNDIVIKTKNLKKIFRYFKKDFRIIIWLFTKKGYTKEFKVLNGIDLAIERSEIVGILGKNGAGKSTLLKIISGIYYPTSGSVEVNGTIASLIELGAGFNAELTGRENLYFKGTLLGLTDKYMEENIDKMIEFADIGDYIDMPLGTYSSGMQARLGFALAVNADPDILIIDEVFAVGDKNFQQKSRAKTEELLKSGKTVLFVSHSEALISEFCTRVVYLKDGKIFYDGPVDRGLAIYHADNLNLPRESLTKYLEQEVVMDPIEGNPHVSFIFEFGIGAGNQLVDEDKFDKFEFNIAKYSRQEGLAEEIGFTEISVEPLNDYQVQISVKLEDIMDSGLICFCYKQIDMDKDYKIAVYNGNNDIMKEDLYGVYIQNVDDKFIYELKTTSSNE